MNFIVKLKKKFKELEDAFGPIGPENIFNCDEFGLSSSQGDTKIICRRGTKNPCVQVADVDKAYYTINYCCNAFGEFLPPYIIFKSVHLYSSWCCNGPPNTGYNTSASGWMEEKTFDDWFTSFFFKLIPAYAVDDLEN
jgi:hypothetical protein